MPKPVFEVFVLAVESVILSLLMSKVRGTGFDLKGNQSADRLAALNNFNLRINPEIDQRLLAKEPAHFPTSVLGRGYSGSFR
jgi:hypothetical protein